MSEETVVCIRAVIIGNRIIQKFPYGEVNEEHCIHGIKLRWSCDSCEDETYQEPEEQGL